MPTQPVEFPVFCAHCGERVPIERARKRSVTCCDAHHKARKAQQREITDSKRCRQCAKPVTLEAQKKYRRWARTARYAAKSKTFAALIAELPAVLELLQSKGLPARQYELDLILPNIAGMAPEFDDDDKEPRDAGQPDSQLALQ